MSSVKISPKIPSGGIFSLVAKCITGPIKFMGPGNTIFAGIGLNSARKALSYEYDRYGQKVIGTNWSAALNTLKSEAGNLGIFALFNSGLAATATVVGLSALCAPALAIGGFYAGWVLAPKVSGALCPDEAKLITEACKEKNIPYATPPGFLESLMGGGAEQKTFMA